MRRPHKESDPTCYGLIFGRALLTKPLLIIEEGLCENQSTDQVIQITFPN